MIGIVWVHGWGSSSDFFKKLTSELPKFTHRFVNLGYFGAEETTPDLSPNINWIAVGHSYGFCWILQQDWKLKALVSINGFSKFTNDNSFKDGVSKKIVQQMLKRFKENPVVILEQFYQKCGFTSYSVSRTLNPEKLRDGLAFLQTVDMRKKLEDSRLPLLALTAEYDSIVSNDALRHYSLAKFKKISDVGHALGLLKTEDCRNEILGFLKEIAVDYEH